MLTFCYRVLCLFKGLGTDPAFECLTVLKFVGWIRLGRIMFRSVKIERWLTSSAYDVG
jgi:hypothetical protein